MKKGRRNYNSVSELVDFSTCYNYWLWRHWLGKGRHIYTPVIEIDTLAHNLFSQSIRIDKQLVHKRFNDEIFFSDFKESYENNFLIPKPKLISFELQENVINAFINELSSLNYARYVSALDEKFNLYSVEGVFEDAILLDGRIERLKGLNKKLVGVPDKIEFWGENKKQAVPIDLKVNETNFEKPKLQLLLYNILCEEEYNLPSDEGLLINFLFNKESSGIKIQRFGREELLEEKVRKTHSELLELKKNKPTFLDIYDKNACNSCLINDFCDPMSVYSLINRGRKVLTRDPKGGFRRIGEIRTVGIEAILSKSAVLKEKNYNFEAVKFFIPPLSELASQVMNEEEYKYFMSSFEYNQEFSNNSSLLRFYFLTDILRHKSFKTKNYLQTFMHASKNSINLHLLVAKKAGLLEEVKVKPPNKKEITAYRIRKEDNKLPENFKNFRKEFRKILKDLNIELKEIKEDMRRWKKVVKIDEERNRIGFDEEKITFLHVTNPEKITRENRYSIEALLKEKI